eukprot:1162787_1
MFKKAIECTKFRMGVIITVPICYYLRFSTVHVRTVVINESLLQLFDVGNRREEMDLTFKGIHHNWHFLTVLCWCLIFAKYTRMGNPEDGRKSQFLKLLYAHLFSPPTTTFSPIDDPSAFTSEKESSSKPKRRVVV